MVDEPSLLTYIHVYMPAIAKLFNNGGSQAVRLPKEFRFEGSEVSVRRVGTGVLIEPLAERAWPPGYWEQLPHLTDDDWQRPSDPRPEPIEAERDVP
jgi:antitoxin VapB